MDNPYKHSRSRVSYSEALQSPTKTTTAPTVHSQVQAARDIQPSRFQFDERFPASLSTPNTKAMKTSSLHSASKPSYSTIAGNSPVKATAPPPTSTQRTLFRAPMSAGFFSSAKPRFPRSQPKTDYPPLEWPTKEPKPVSYDWDPDYVAAGAAKYAEEKANNERAKLPATAGNGLINAIDSHQKKVALRKWAKERTLGAQTRSSGLHAVVETAARDGVAKHGSGKLPVGSTNTRIGGFMMGRPVHTTATYKKSSAKATETKPNYISKPTIPFNRSSYSDCSNWLTGFDEIPKDEDGRLKLPEESYIRGGRVLPGNDEHAVGSSNTDSAATEIYVGPQRPGQSFGNHSGYYGPSDKKPQDRNDPEPQPQDCNESQGSPGPTVLYWQTPLELKASIAKVVPRQLFYPRDDISHTQTKTWTSPKENERVRFIKIQSNFRHAGFHKSPFIPKTFDEYLVHKAVYAMYLQLNINKNMQEKEKVKEAIQQHLREGGDPKDAMPVAVTFPHWLTDLEKDTGVTAVNARASIWTTRCLMDAEIAWPEYNEYKAQGGENGMAQYGHYFPLPRSLVLAEEHHHQLEGRDPLPLKGTGVPWNKRMVAEFARVPTYDMTYTGEFTDLCMTPLELDLAQVNPITREFIASTAPSDDGDE